MLPADGDEDTAKSCKWMPGLGVGDSEEHVLSEKTLFS